MSKSSQSNRPPSTAAASGGAGPHGTSSAISSTEHSDYIIDAKTDVKKLRKHAHQTKNINLLKTYLTKHYNIKNPEKVQTPASSDTLREELLWAIEENKTDYINFLLETYPTLYHSFMRNRITTYPAPLIHAIKKGKFEIAMNFLNLLTLPDDPDLFKRLDVEKAIAASSFDYSQKIKIRTKIQEKLNPIMQIVKTATPESVKASVEKLKKSYDECPNIHCEDSATGTDAFKEAIKKNIPALVEWFLDAKEHKEMPNKKTKDKDGFTAFMHAVNFADNNDNKPSQEIQTRRDIQSKVANYYGNKPDWDTLRTAANAKNYSFVKAHSKLFAKELITLAIENNDQVIFDEAHRHYSTDSQYKHDVGPSLELLIHLRLALEKTRAQMITKLLDIPANWRETSIDPLSILCKAVAHKTCSIEDAETIIDKIREKNIGCRLPSYTLSQELLSPNFLRIMERINYRRNYIITHGWEEDIQSCMLEIASANNNQEAVNYILLGKVYPDESLIKLHALSTAIYYGHLQITKTLLMDPSVPYHDAYQKTALTCATRSFVRLSGVEANPAEKTHTQNFVKAYEALINSESESIIQYHLAKLTGEDIKSLKEILKIRKQEMLIEIMEKLIVANTDDKKETPIDTKASAISSAAIAETTRSVSPPKPDEKKATAPAAEPTPMFSMFSATPNTATAVSTPIASAPQAAEIKISPKPIIDEEIISSPRSAVSQSSPQFFQPAATPTTLTPPTNEPSQVDLLSNTAELMHILREFTENFNKQHPIPPELLNGLHSMYLTNAAELSQRALEASQNEIEGQTPPPLRTK